MHQFGLRFHHFGIALRSKENAIRFLSGSGYSVGSFLYDPEQKVWLALCRGEGLPILELVLPGAEDGPLRTLLKRQESAIYHQAYLAHDATTALAAMTASGLQVLTVSPPKPAVLFLGIPVSFHYVSGFGLIELIHSVYVLDRSTHHSEAVMHPPLVYSTLTEIFNDVFDCNIHLTPELAMEDVDGWDSLSHIRLMIAIEQRFGVKFNAAEVASFFNIGQLVDLVQMKLETVSGI